MASLPTAKRVWRRANGGTRALGLDLLAHPSHLPPLGRCDKELRREDGSKDLFGVQHPRCVNVIQRSAWPARCASCHAVRKQARRARRLAAPRHTASRAPIHEPDALAHAPRAAPSHRTACRACRSLRAVPMHNTASCLARPNAAPARPLASLPGRRRVQVALRGHDRGQEEHLLPQAREHGRCVARALSQSRSRDRAQRAEALLCSSRALAACVPPTHAAHAHRPLSLAARPVPPAGNAPRGSSAGAAGAAVAAGGVSLTGV